MMKKISSSGIFKDFYDENKIYIDKTQIIYNLISDYKKVFISRPRRFGKSLTLNTIGTLFENGVDPYFKNTWIYDKWQDTTYPVLKLNFTDFDTSIIEEFKRQLVLEFTKFATVNKVDGYISDVNPATALKNLLDALSQQKRRIVILIDEYDCQLTANINNESLYYDFKTQLRNLYAVIKSQESIKFMAITGVTRLKDVTIFSVGSDIADITHESYYSQLIGFTREEIKKYYKEYLTIACSIDKNISVKDVCDDDIDAFLNKMACEYDGYCFDGLGVKKVFSTWSVNNFLKDVQKNRQCIFGEYWYENGGLPTILANYLKNHELNVFDYLNKDIVLKVKSDDIKNPTDLISINQHVLMCQTGYLTLNSTINQNPVILSVPNGEVHKALLRLLSLNFFEGKVDVTDDLGKNILDTGSIEQIINLFNSILNTVAYDNYPIDSESAVQSHIQLYLIGAQMKVCVENHTSKGRSDLIIETENRRIIVEFKYTDDDSKADILLSNAEDQLKNNDYSNIVPIKNDVLKIAAVFNGNKETRAFVKYKAI